MCIVLIEGMDSLVRAEKATDFSLGADTFYDGLTFDAAKLAWITKT